MNHEHRLMLTTLSNKVYCLDCDEEWLPKKEQTTMTKKEIQDFAEEVQRCNEKLDQGDANSMMISQINRNLQKIYSWHDQDVEFRREMLEALASLGYTFEPTIAELRKKFL